MPEKINWKAVWQSITDTWTPLFITGVVMIGLFIFGIIRKRRKK